MGGLVGGLTVGLVGGLVGGWVGGLVGLHHIYMTSARLAFFDTEVLQVSDLEQRRRQPASNMPQGTQTASEQALLKKNPF